MHPPPPARSTRQTWGLIGSGVGLVAGVGLAIWVKAEADDRYDRYLTIADPEVAAKAFNAAQRYDRATLIGWAMAQVSFVSLVYFLTQEGKRPLVSGKGEALIEPSGDGVRVGIRRVVQEGGPPPGRREASLIPGAQVVGSFPSKGVVVVSALPRARTVDSVSP